MQRTRLPVVLIILTVAASCALRFFQLLRLTDTSTGLVDSSSPTSAGIYICLALCLAFSFWYGVITKKKQAVFDIENSGKSVGFLTLLMAVFFFADFIHQCYNCYSYVESVSYIEYTYVVPLVISSVFAVISCFYFLIFYLSSRGTNYDFRNFTVFHFAPAIWAFARLCVIMSKLVDPIGGIETCLEFLVLILAICFNFCFLSGLDKKKAQVTSLFSFSAVSLSSFCIVLTVPRILMIISGNIKLLVKPDFSTITYLVLGLFALAVIRDISKKNTKEIY